MLENETIHAIAKKYKRSLAQIIGRWNMQNDVLHVVKASTPKHQRENLNLFDFELSDEDMEKIDVLDIEEAGRIEGQDPNEYEEFD